MFRPHAILDLALVAWSIWMSGCGYEDTREGQRDAGLDAGGNLEDGGDADADEGNDAAMEASDDASADGAVDAGYSCEEWMDLQGNCYKEFPCYCDKFPGDCQGLGAIEKASIWIEDKIPLTGIRLCLYRCNDGGGYLDVADEVGHGDTHYYDSISGELIGVRIYTDVPVYCNSSQWEILYGLDIECTVGCVEIPKNAIRPIADFCGADFPLCE